MRYTAKKIATMLLTMVIVSFLTFVAFSLLSGDAGETYLTLMQRNYEALKGGLL